MVSAPRSKPAATAARATGMMIALVLLSRVLGVVREMVLARLFGQNAITDTYNAAFRVPDILYLLVAGGALSTVFVPVFAEYWNDRREEEAWRTFGSVITIVAVLAAVLVIVMEIVAYPVTDLLNPRFSDDAVARTTALSRILLPAQWCFFVGGLMMGTLNARHRFLVPALGPVIYNGGIIAGGLVVWLARPDLYQQRPEVGIQFMAWGALAGAFLGNFLLPALEMRRIRMQWLPGLDFRHPGVIKVGRLMLPALLGLSLSQLGFWITGSFLPAAGKYTALKNAYALTQAPIGVFAQASAIVLLPTISFLAAQRDWPAFRVEVSQGIRRILFLTIPASLLMAALAEPIVRLLFAGPKFGPAEVRMAASALLWYSLGTFAWSAQAVLARGFYAMQDTRTPVVITTGMVALFTALCFVAVAMLGTNEYLGLAFAMSVVATLNMLIFLVVLGRRVGGLDVRGMARSAALITVAASLSGLSAWAIARGLDGLLPDTKPGAALTLLAASGIALAVYTGVCALLRVPELSGVGAMFRRENRR